MPKCPSSSLQVSFHHGVNLKHSDVRRKEKKKTHDCKINFDPSLLVCYIVFAPFIIPSFPNTPACGSLRESRLHSLPSVSLSLSLALNRFQPLNRDMNHTN